MGIHEAAIFRDGADAVRIAIGGQASVTSFLQNRLPQHFYVRFDGLRIDSGKERIQFLTNGDILNSASLENLRYHTSARTVHRIHCEFETSFCDQVEICKPANGF